MEAKGAVGADKAKAVVERRLHEPWIQTTPKAVLQWEPQELESDLAKGFRAAGVSGAVASNKVEGCYAAGASGALGASGAVEAY